MKSKRAAGTGRKSYIPQVRSVPVLKKTLDKSRPSEDNKYDADDTGTIEAQNYVAGVF